MHPRLTSLALDIAGKRRRSRRSATLVATQARKRSILPASFERLEGRQMLTTFYAATSYFDQTTSSNTSTPANGDTVTWDKGNPDQVTGLVFGTNAFTGIQDAINATSNGDTVRVAAGLYQLTTELDIGTSISVLGPQADIDPRPSAGSARVAGGSAEAILDGGGNAGAFDAFFVEASNVTINGFDLRNTADEVIDTDGSASYSNIQILNNFIHGAGDPANGKGVHFEGVTGGLVANNDFYDIEDSDIEIGSGSVANSPNCVVKDNEVHDNVGAGGTTNAAIYAFATPFASAISVTIQGNLIYNFSGNDGIKVGSKDGSDHALAGGSVLDNVVHDVVQDGITIDASNTQVSGNEVYHSSSSNAAIYVEHSDGNVTLSNNYLHDNTATIATILVGDGTIAPTGVVVSENSLQGNTQNSLLYRDLASGHTVDASTNWWGSSNPATVEADVQSTTPGAVDFTPWLNNGTNTSPTTPGFTPDLSSLTVAPSTISAQTGAIGRIQEAINLATSGGTITVLNGTYNEDVNVNKNVTIDVSGIVNGKLAGSTGTIVATGSLSLGDGSATAVNMATNLSVGTQTVTLLDSAPASLAGSTTISTGGSLVAANGIGIASGGTLSGTGSVAGDLSVASGGTVAPGANLGLLSADNVSLSTGSTFDETINSFFLRSQLVATGTVSLNGATLSGTTNYSVSPGSQFTIIKNNGPNPIVGTFNGLPEGSTVDLGNGIFSISYVGGAGHDVVLTALNAVPTITGFVPPALVEGSGDTLVTVNGTGFVNGSTVQVNGIPVATTFFTGSQLQATIPAADMAEEGSLSITVVTPGPGGGTSAAVTLPINDAPLNGTGLSLAATEGTTFTGTVASFTDADPNGAASDYTASIVWGDGTTTTADSITASGGGFVVVGTHAYIEDGSFTVSVVVHDAGGASATSQSTATVSEPALALTAVTVNGNELSSLSNVTVATFTHGSGIEPASGFSATIDWGDGATSAGTIALSGTTYSVVGTHTYNDEGKFAIHVTVTDESTSATMATTATLLEELLPGGVRGTANERYISELYRDLLHRAVEPGGLAFWDNLLGQGESRAQIAQQIIAAGAPFEYYRTIVNGLYETYLHRAADPNGLQFYANLMHNGATAEQIAGSIVASLEFAQRSGSTNDGFLSELYLDALHRPIDAGAETYFSNLLAQGATRGDVAAMVFASHEYHGDLVDSLYLEYLDRPSDAGGRAAFTTELDNGATDQQLTVQLVASDEYFAKTSS
jgi:hypothetical protein